MIGRVSPIVLLALFATSISAFAPAALQQPKVSVTVAPWGVTTSMLENTRSNSRLSNTRVFAEKEGGGVKLIIAGAPASGKGTQCEIIKEKFGVVHLSTGDMLRAAVAAQTEVGKSAKEYMDNGKLVPDEVIIGVVSSKVGDTHGIRINVYFRGRVWIVWIVLLILSFRAVYCYINIRLKIDWRKTTVRNKVGCSMDSHAHKRKQRHSKMPVFLPIAFCF